MVNTKIFNFGSKYLKIITIKELDDSFTKDIQFFLNSFTFELNHNVKNSSAGKFNQSQVNIPVFLEKTFIDFFKYNIDFYIHFKDKFQPFKSEDQNLDNINKLYLIDSQDETIIKLRKFTLDTSFLRSSYTIELLKNYLEENDIKDYLIVLPNSNSAFGKNSWKCDFAESEQFNNKTFELKNSNALLVQNIVEKTKIKEMVLIGKDLSYLKVIENTLKKQSSRDELLKSAKDYKIDIVITNDNKVEILRGDI